ncbi:hypothetical protein ACFOG5_11905 [Pedobacter fastidiosus]|uniref:VCBS repeat-containing protein n=1 Tax=Pedobacter fastidiosus TaxID=2765361 RepID=A0ABR7KWU4_9SPHI|nr:hypothetical protein [Pedobacter fastidiosus]MBC6112547.1 hypothetical protein [Pedobacter fastidiosus]
MKKSLVYALVIALFMACNDKSQSVNEIKIDYNIQKIDTIILNEIDTAFVVGNKIIDGDIGDKQKEYSIKIYFSNNLPELTYKNAIGADLYLANDLDGDGKAELLLRPEWFSSCWTSVNLFSLKNNIWKLVKSGSMYYCSDEYPLSKRIVQMKQGYSLLTDSLADTKFVTLKKEIKF